MIVLPYSPEGDPSGSWRHGLGGAVVTCPGCQEERALDHDVAADGTVTPSLDCPTKGCSFHDHVQLANWPPPRSRK